MTELVVAAYIPVLHEGYWRFLDRHARGLRLFVIGPSLVPDYPPLAKDVRRLDPGVGMRPGSGAQVEEPPDAHRGDADRYLPRAGRRCVHILQAENFRSTEMVERHSPHV